jgi:hypothetical protein
MKEEGRMRKDRGCAVTVSLDFSSVSEDVRRRIREAVAREINAGKAGHPRIWVGGGSIPAPPGKKSQMGTNFDVFFEDIKKEAAAEGPEAVEELQRLAKKFQTERQKAQAGHGADGSDRKT